MAFSFTHVLGDGTTTLFQVPFDYLNTTHVGVAVDGVAAPFIWEGQKAVRLARPAPADSVVEIRRMTPGAARIVDFTDGSVLTEADLDASAIQLLFLTQEAADNASAALRFTNRGPFDANGRSIVNLADPTTPSSAATQRWSLALLEAERTEAERRLGDASTSLNRSLTDLGTVVEANKALAERNLSEAIDAASSRTVFVFIEKDERAESIAKPYYIHQQVEAAAVWVIKHNLDTYPKPTVYDSTGTFLNVEWAFSTSNEMRLNLSEPTAGIAYVS